MPRAAVLDAFFAVAFFAVAGRLTFLAVFRLAPGLEVLELADFRAGAELLVAAAFFVVKGAAFFLAGAAFLAPPPDDFVALFFTAASERFRLELAAWPLRPADPAREDRRGAEGRPLFSASSAVSELTILLKLLCAPPAVSS